MNDDQGPPAALADAAAAAPFRRLAATAAVLRTAIGQKTADGISLESGPGYALFGCYEDLAAGAYLARILLAGPGDGSVTIDIAARFGAVVLASRRVELASIENNAIDLHAALPFPLSGCEVRLYCHDRVRADIRGLEIYALGAELSPSQSALARRVDYFTRCIGPKVEGWLGSRMHEMIRVIGPIFDLLGVKGNIAEIGVHHGLFFFLLNAIRRDTERCFAIDLFDDQELNIDHSGSGSLSTFVSHLENLLPAEQEFVDVHKRDSLNFSIGEFERMFAPDGVKLFSVDGGHTVMHVCNDLSLVQEVVVPGAIVALDDFFGPHWPTVTEGFYLFMETRNRRLSPLLFFQNKLFLTTLSEHDLWLEHLAAGLEAVLGKDDLGHWRYVEIAGAKVLSHGRREFPEE